MESPCYYPFLLVFFEDVEGAIGMLLGCGCESTRASCESSTVAPSPLVHSVKKRLFIFSSFFMSVCCSVLYFKHCQDKKQQRKQCIVINRSIMQFRQVGKAPWRLLACISSAARTVLSFVTFSTSLPSQCLYFTLYLVSKGLALNSSSASLKKASKSSTYMLLRGLGNCWAAQGRVHMLPLGCQGEPAGLVCAYRDPIW